MRQMIVGAFAALLVVLATDIAHAQAQSVPPDVMKGLAKDLANLQAQLQAAQEQAQAQLQAQAKGPAGEGAVKVTAAEAPLYAGADYKAMVINKAPKDKMLYVLDKAGTWYAVKDGDTHAWVPASDVVPESDLFFIDTSRTGFKWPYIDPNTGKPISAQATTAPPAPATDPTVLDRMYESITTAAESMKEKYAANPYIDVTGFAVTVGFPPSVSMNFGFKSAAAKK
jgi:hypothetical protein